MLGKLGMEHCRKIYFRCTCTCRLWHCADFSVVWQMYALCWVRV